jgi:hypothetical protein
MVAYYKTGNISHKKGQGTGGKRGRPFKNGKSKQTRHWDALSAARAVAYARRDGANDALLARYLIYSFGLGNIPCIIAQTVLFASEVIMLSVAFRLARGLSYVYRGIMLVVEGNEANYMGELFHELLAVLQLEFDVEIPLWMTKGQWLLWIGSLQAGLSAVILFFDSFRDTIIYFRFLDLVCRQKIEDKPFRITPKFFNR